MCPGHQVAAGQRLAGRLTTGSQLAAIVAVLREDGLSISGDRLKTRLRRRL